MDAQRALLDELMGRDRNLLPSQKSGKELHFSDPEVCKYFICGFCPNELFTNTKSDLGACKKIHDETCREEFLNSSKKHQYPYEQDFLHFLEKLVDDLDRRIRKSHDRLYVQQDEPAELPVSGENAEKLAALSERIQTILAEIETLAEEGQVEESQKLMKAVDDLRLEKENLLSGNDVLAQEKRMKICDICGAFLVVGDTDKRASSHLEGKQHQGFALIRKKISELRSTLRDDDRRKERGNYNRGGGGGGHSYDRERYDRGGDRDRRHSHPYNGGRRDYREQDGGYSRSDHRGRDYPRHDRDYNGGRDRDQRRRGEREYYDRDRGFDHSPKRREDYPQ